MKNKYLYPILTLIFVLIVWSIGKYLTEQVEDPLSENVFSEQEPEEIRVKPLALEVSSDPKLLPNSLLDRYYNSDDFFELALSLLDDSLNGDAESQYFLFWILFECSGYTENTISYALLVYEQSRLSPNLAHIKEIENDVSKCSGFTKNNLNHFYKKSRYEWLKMAADNKYPLAMAMYAKEAIETLQGDLTPMPRAGLTFKSASEMLFQSLKFDEPATYIEVAQLVESIPDQTAWGLLACRTGYNCKDKSVQFLSSSIVMACLIMKSEPDCFEKANLHSFITLGLDEESIQAAIARSYEIETKLKNKDYQGIGLDAYLDYVKEK